MLVENTREETLKAFLNGNQAAMAAVKTAEGGMQFVRVSDLLPADAVYFIDMELGSEDDYEEKVLRHCQGGTEKGMSEVKPKRKTAGDIIEPYVRQGLSDSEIAEKTGIKYGTVWTAAKKIRERLAETKGRNADRHLCKTCKYRALNYNQKRSGIKCEYALKSGTKRTRGCDVEDCDKYEKGAPVKVKDEA